MQCSSKRASLTLRKGRKNKIAVRGTASGEVTSCAGLRRFRRFLVKEGQGKELGSVAHVVLAFDWSGLNWTGGPS